MPDHGNDASSDALDTVAVDAIPAPVVGYEVADGTARIAATNDATNASFDATSIGTSLREWLLGNGAVDEATVADACSALADGDAIDVEIGVRPGGDAAAERRPVRLRSFEGADGSDRTEGQILVTELSPTRVDGVEHGSVTSVITHDLRNPLDVANAHLRAARETGDEEHFDQVKESHDRMERIIQDALTLARGERALDVTENVAIGDVAADAWATVDTGTASLDADDELPRIDADPDRLQRLFENLFRNAIEHGSTDNRETADSNGDEPVHVRVGNVDGGFFVADDGPGIPADERDRVFEAGYSSSETGSGTGLGLTIVERIARAHDWTVSLTEGSRGGARFEFRPIQND
ncbi:HAMP domain-containing sensor histidine kinase [Natronoarchaeum mannanilyticum]|uniref:histidine kinase n=1 Tax=Natronoarchaeum mannanilyticum TaxID=926360 RepID=A0AAV3T8I5_9EURY